MSCPMTKCLCKHLIISTAVNFDGTNVLVGIPAGSYLDGEKYCIVIAQNIPTTATINAPVIIRIGATATNYPMVNCDGTPVTACSINTRTRYSTRVDTTPTGGNFRLTGKLSCSRCGNLPSIS